MVKLHKIISRNADKKFLKRQARKVKQYEKEAKRIETFYRSYQPSPCKSLITGEEVERQYVKIRQPKGKKRNRKTDNSKFYKSREWRELRYKALKLYGRRCAVCGVAPSDGAVLHVDHIKPLSKHPELALSIDNLQIMCADCNIGKSNYDCIDWRDKE